MGKEIRIPEVSDGVVKGTVISVSVAVGDKVEFDQTLLELETDKAVVAIPSPFAGTITEIRVAEGESVAIGAVIMVCETEPLVGAAGGRPGLATAPDPDPKAVGAAGGRPGLAMSPGTDKVDLETVRTGDEVAPAAPSVRRAARELGVDIYQVKGSGPAGRISEEDVKAYVRETLQRLSSDVALRGGQAPSRPLPDFAQWGPIRREPLSRVREVTAESMTYAWATPMVTQFDKADITDLEEFRKRANAKAKPEAKLTMTAILLKVCAVALRAFPQFNSSLDLGRSELIYKDTIHIGVAADTPRGLLVPVIRDVDQKGIERLAVELNEAAAKARDRKLTPDEMAGGSFTISNLGGIGGTNFTPIVYSPQVAILGVSRAEQTPVWNGSGFGPRLMMPLSLTYDHRVIDGADAARFLRWICEGIAQPIQLLMKG
ncbi:MAG: hypothetical protein AUK47_27115 [Deltaproteobacteria bacterium CG2_30_63_29]|nr:MAG: hypothetical protein AUK47_27115 [Deltaproteobacteria bacterium CG2_30_63_29]